MGSYTPGRGTADPFSEEEQGRAIEQGRPGTRFPAAPIAPPGAQSGQVSTPGYGTAGGAAIPPAQDTFDSPQKSAITGMLERPGPMPAEPVGPSPWLPTEGYQASLAANRQPAPAPAQQVGAGRAPTPMPPVPVPGALGTTGRNPTPMPAQVIAPRPGPGPVPMPAQQAPPSPQRRPPAPAPPPRQKRRPRPAPAETRAPTEGAAAPEPQIIVPRQRRLPGEGRGRGDRLY